MTVQSVYTTKEVAENIGISPSTLRKYCLLIEAAGYKVPRNERNDRMFYDSDVLAIRSLRKLVDDGTPVEKAAKEVSVKLSNREEVKGNPPAPNDAQVIKELSDKIDKLAEVILKMTEEQEKERLAFRSALRMIEKQQEVIEEIKTPNPIEEKQTLWNRLFKK